MRLRHLVFAVALAVIAAPVAQGCVLNRTHGSCSVPAGGNRCDGNVLVSCGNKCDDSGCDNITIFDVRTDCGSNATCTGSSGDSVCVSKGVCADDIDCCVPSPGYMDCTHRCKAGVCVAYLYEGAPCDADPSGCQPGLHCAPPVLDGGADSGGADGSASADDGGSDAGTIDAGSDAGNADAGARLVCQR